MKKLCFLLILPFVVGCVSRQQQNISTIDINIHNAKQAIHTSSFIKDVEIISLETKDECLIGKIKCISLKNNNIYIADKRALYKFDNKGRYVAKIKKNGMGPDEYINISWFDIDSLDNAYILSYDDECIYKYKWDGNLIDKIEIGFLGKQIHLMDNNEIIAYGKPQEGSPKIRKIPYSELKNEELLTINPKIAKYLYFETVIPAFFQADSCIFFCEPYNDTIYSISNNTVNYKYVINYSGLNIPQKFMLKKHKDIREFNEKLNKHNYIRNFGFFAETSNYLINEFKQTGKLYFALINKDNGECIVANEVRDDVLLANFRIYPRCVDKQKIIANFDVEDLKEHTDGLDEETKKRIMDLIEYSGADANPILYFATIK